MTKPSNPLVKNSIIKTLAAVLLLAWAGAHSLPARALEAAPALEQNLREAEGARTASDNVLRDTVNILATANQDYLDGEYEEAAQGYETILAGGHLNGHLHYNLGNCYIRLGQVGKAILNYDKAQLLLPRDGDLQANLQYARSLSQDRIEAKSSLWRTLAFWYFGMNLRELLITLAVFNVILWTSALFRLFRDREWIKWSIALSLLLTVTMGVSAGMKYRETFHNHKGVVLVREAPVRAGFNHKDTVLFVLHEGAEFGILGQEKGWWKIELPDGKKGWLPAGSAGEVSLTKSPRTSHP